MTSVEQFRLKCLKPSFRFFLLTKLPLAFLAGVKISQFDEDKCVSTINFRWLNQNPFKSIYFAALQMAAELCTGLLLYQYLSKESNFSMLLVSVKSNFTKKAVGCIKFTCSEVQVSHVFIQDVLNSEQGMSRIFNVTATNDNSEIVANFEFEWSCKRRTV